ncbi:MAG: PIN domain-containing protein [Verrucomicrobiota bacterium]|nr:PIN domain-containing protein [Verrucomicrobiota bacterium]
MVLVDSSVYIQLIRDGKNPVRTLAEAFDATEIVGCSVVRCEVLRGMIRPKPKAYLAEFFDLLIHVPTDDRVWRETEDLAWQLDRRGRVLPLTDVLIAVCALRIGAAVLTLDRHFKEVPDLEVVSW